MDKYMCIAHHGIKGQKWGVRRYQNPDGTLTEYGKHRYKKETIAKGSSVRRITDAKVKGSSNPIGMYTYGESSEDAYKSQAKNLPGIDRRSKKMRVTQYEFTRDAALLSGEQSVKAYMDYIGDMSMKTFRNDYWSYSDNPAYNNVDNFIERQSKDVSIRDISKKAHSISDKLGQDFVNTVAGYTFGSSDFSDGALDGTRKTHGEKFVSRMKDLGYDVIVDPEDYSNPNFNFKESYIILNNDVVKESGSYKERIKR